jgi:formyltetrahydrofolate synthetase
MMKHLFIRNQFGGLGPRAHIIGGHIGQDGTQEVVMEAMDTGEEEEEDIHAIGVAQDLGAAVVEEHILVDLVAE